MSDNKNGISPFRDEEYLKSSSSRNNRSAEFRSKLTEEDKNEFNEVFSDDELDDRTHDGTGFFASFRVGPDTKKPSEKPHKPPVQKNEVSSVKKAAAPKNNASEPKNTHPAPKQTSAAEANDSLYSVPGINIDALISSLSAGTAIPEYNPESSASTDAVSSEEHTIAFSVTPPVQKQNASERTRHFNLSSALKAKKAAAKPQKKADIMGNVRVLSGDKKDDEAILEAVPSKEDAVNPLDVVTPEKGEDIFAAVDKAVRKSKNTVHMKIPGSASQAKKKEQGSALTGKELVTALSKSCSFMKLQLIFSVALFFLTAVLTILPSFYSEGNALEFMFTNGGRIYALINIALLVPLVLIFIKNYISAVRGIISLKPNGDTVLLIITLFVFLHDAIAGILKTAGLDGVRMYTLVAVFAVGVKCIGDYFRTSSTLHSVKAMLRSKAYQSVHPITNKTDADALAQGITDKGKPCILYGTDSDAPAGIPEDVTKTGASHKYYTFMSIAVILFSLILSVFAYLRTGNAGQYLTVLLSTVCLCLPVLSDTVRSINIYLENLPLHKKGSAVSGYDALELAGKANGVAMDISDIFAAEVSSFRLVPGAGIDKNDAALCACSVTVGAHSLIGRCFEDFAKQTERNIPEAENVQYEEFLGFSAWVDGKRVLVGNREMLIQHSIPAPDEAEEKKYAKNRFLMYLVIEGQLTATFLVNYKILSSVKKLSLRFNKTGLMLMLTSKEPFLSHGEIAKRLGLDTAGIKVLSGKGAAIIGEYRSDRIPKKASGLICSKKSGGLLPLILTAHSLYNSDKLIFNIGLLGQAAALVLVALSQLLSLPLFHSPFAIIFVQLLWSTAIWLLCSKKFIK